MVNNKDENQSLFDVVVDYTYALDTLDNYDYQRLTISDTTLKEQFHATYENAMEAIQALRDKFGGSVLFGNEKDDSFKSSIGQIYQTLWRRGTLSQCRGKGRHVVVSGYKEPLIQRWQQAHCCHIVPVVPE